MFALMRRDAALRSLVPWLLVTWLGAGFLMWTVSAALAAGRMPGPGLLTAILWATVSPYLLLGAVRRRAGELDLVLPQPAPRLWLAHLLAVALGAVLLLALTAGISASVLSLLERLHPQRLAGLSLLRLALPLAGWLVLAVAVLEGRALGRARIRMDLPEVGWRLAVLATAGGLAIVLAGGPPAWALAPLAAASGVVAVRWRAVPPALNLEPGRTRSEVAGEAAWVAPSGAPGRPSWWLLFRCMTWAPVTGGAAIWLSLAFAFLFAAMPGGLVQALASDGLSRFDSFPLAIYVLVAMAVPLIVQLRHLDPLPVPRSKLFVLWLGPFLLATVAGFSVGALALAASGHGEARVAYRVEGASRWVEVPERFLAIAWDGLPPALTTPWGESHPAWSVPLVAGAVVYSPFNTPEESSARFEAVMTSRALAAVRGVTVAPERILSEAFETDGERLLAVRPQALEELVVAAGTPAAGAAESGAPAAGPSVAGERARGALPGTGLALFLLLAVVPALLLLAGVLATLRPGLPRWVAPAAWLTVMGLSLTLMLGQVVLQIAGVVHPLAVRAALELALTQLSASPGRLIALWLFATVAVAAAWRLARRSFLRLELPTPPPRFTLIQCED
jgi:hypothetical protein